MSAEVKTAAEWCEVAGVKVLDPDGWDRDNFAESWAEPLTELDFARRVSESTASGGQEWVKAVLARGRGFTPQAEAAYPDHPLDPDDRLMQFYKRQAFDAGRRSRDAEIAEAAEFIDREMRDGFLNPNVVAPGSKAHKHLLTLIGRG